MAFDPDDYLKKQKGFDSDVYLQGSNTPESLKSAQTTQYLQNTMSTPEAWLADIGATISKIGPNLRRLAKGADDPEAMKELQEIERMQGILRTAFPSSTFAGDVALPGATAAATMGLGAVPATVAGMVEAAGLSSSEQSPRENAAMVGGFAALTPIASRAISSVLSGAEAGLLKLEDIVTASSDQQAGRVIKRYLDEAGLTIDDVLKAREALPEGSTLADVQSMRGISQKAAMTPAGRTYTEAFEKRQLAQQERLFNKMYDLTGERAEDFYQNFNAMVSQRKAKAKPLYDAAAEVTLPIDEETGVLLKKLKNSGALSRARKIAGIKGEEIKDEISIGFLHETKTALDDLIGNAKQKGEGGLVSALDGLKRELLDVMDSTSPDYAEARRIFASESEIINAAELGETLFNPRWLGRKISFEEMRDTVSKFGADQFQAFQAGVVKSVSDKLAKVPETADAARRLWTNRDVRQKIGLAFQDPAQFDGFLDYLGKESDFTDTLRELYQGSQTAQRTFADTAMGLSSQSARQAVNKVLSGAIDDAGMRELSRLMFDSSVSNDYIAGVLARANLVSSGNASKAAREIRENWDKIYAAFDRNMNATTRAATAGALVPTMQE